MFLQIVEPLDKSKFEDELDNDLIDFTSICKHSQNLLRNRSFSCSVNEKIIRITKVKNLARNEPEVGLKRNFALQFTLTDIRNKAMKICYDFHQI